MADFLHPVNKFCDDEITKILLARLSEKPVEERLRIISMSQMFSFWNEIQSLLQQTADEIVVLKSRIKELEETNAKEKN